MFTMKLAGNAFTVYNRFPFVEKLCMDYCVPFDDRAPRVEISDGERAFENQDGGNWEEGYLESLAVYRKICEALIRKDLVLFHSSALALEKGAVLFTGPSGTGKSTHARLWRRRFGDRLVTVNDDKPLLTVGSQEVRVWGTPYAGKDGLQTNTSAPVRGIIILKQAPENRIRQLTAHEAFPYLLNQTYHPRNPEDMVRTLDLVQRLSCLPVYELGCTISQEAVTLGYEALFGKEETI